MVELAPEAQDLRIALIEFLVSAGKLEDAKKEIEAGHASSS